MSYAQPGLVGQSRPMMSCSGLIPAELDAAVVFVEYADYLVDVDSALHPPRARTLPVHFGFLAWRAVAHHEIAVRHSNYLWAASAGAEEKQQGK